MRILLGLFAAVIVAALLTKWYIEDITEQLWRKDADNEEGEDDE